MALKIDQKIAKDVVVSVAKCIYGPSPNCASNIGILLVF